MESPRKNQIKETDSDYIKLAKKGGHSGWRIAMLSHQIYVHALIFCSDICREAQLYYILENESHDE